jgi:hypothetical protein
VERTFEQEPGAQRGARGARIVRVAVQLVHRGTRNDLQVASTRSPAC